MSHQPYKDNPIIEEQQTHVNPTIEEQQTHANPTIEEQQTHANIVYKFRPTNIIYRILFFGMLFFILIYAIVNMGSKIKNNKDDFTGTHEDLASVVNTLQAAHIADLEAAHQTGHVNDFIMSDNIEKYFSGAMTLNKYDSRIYPCPFRDSDMKLLNRHGCTVEMNTINTIFDNIEPGMTVIEFGARMGTATCALSKAVGSNGKVVAVEPDLTVWTGLRNNLKQNGCLQNVHILYGALSSKDIYLDGKGGHGPGHDYGQSTTNTLRHEGHDKFLNTRIPVYDFKMIKLMFGIGSFDAIVADCQGCFPSVVKEFPQLLDMSRIIIMEEDYFRGSKRKFGNRIEYNELHNVLINHRFKLKYHEKDTGAKNPTSNNGDFIWKK